MMRRPAAVPVPPRTTPLPPQPRRLLQSHSSPGDTMWRTMIKGVLATILASTPVIAQTGTISGRVTAAEGGVGLPRVQVTVPGTGSGTLTREDGRYSLVIAPGRYTVVASRIGLARDSMTGVQVTGGAASTVNF